MKPINFKILKIISISKENNYTSLLDELEYTFRYHLLIKVDDKEYNAYIRTTLSLRKDIVYFSDNYNINQEKIFIQDIEPIKTDVVFQLLTELYKDFPNFPIKKEEQVEKMCVNKNIKYTDANIFEDYIEKLIKVIDAYYEDLGFNFLLNLFHYYQFEIKPMKVKDTETGEDKIIVYITKRDSLYSLDIILKDPYFTSLTNLSTYDELEQNLTNHYPLKSFGLLHEMFLQSIGRFRNKDTKERFFYNERYSFLTFKQVHTTLAKRINISKPQLTALLNNAIKLNILVKKDDKYYLKELYDKELYIEKKVKSLKPASKKMIISDEIIDVASDPKIHGKDQKKAIKEIVSQKDGLRVLIGGPGTGKTTTLSTIIKLFRVMYKVPNEKMLFLAPTAKAKDVLANAINEPTYTLKDALIQGLIPLYDFIVIDESGVMSVFDFFELMTQMKKGQKLLLMGDAGQLQSVEFGVVLKDIEEKGAIPINKLTEVFRQKEGSPIIDLAYGLDNQKVSQKMLISNEQNFFVERVANLNAFIQELDLELNFFEKSQYIQIISPVTVYTPLGAYKNNPNSFFPLNTTFVNKKIQDYRIAKYHPKQIKIGNRLFLEGDKVMHTINKKKAKSESKFEDNELTVKTGVSNGEFGIIKKIEKDFIYVAMDALTVFKYSIRDKNAELHIDQLEIAYAITVLKSQGSEWNTVIMLLDDNPKTKPALSRNLLYTGITRSSENLIIGYNFVQKKTILNYFQEASKKSSSDSTKSDLFNKERSDENE